MIQFISVSRFDIDTFDLFKKVYFTFCLKNFSKSSCKLSDVFSKIGTFKNPLSTGARYFKTIYSNYMGGRRTISTDTLEANTSLLAIYKKEELLNIVQPPKVRNKVFISRGGEDIFERHSIMSEIKTRDDIDEYRNGYF